MSWKWYINSFSNIYWIPAVGSVLSTMDSAVKKVAKNLCPLGTCILMGSIAVLRYFILLNSYSDNIIHILHTKTCIHTNLGTLMRTNTQQKIIQW